MSNMPLRDGQAMAGRNGGTLSWRVSGGSDKAGPEGLLPCEICSPDSLIFSLVISRII